MSRSTKLIITGGITTPLLAFLHFAASQAAEPFYGPPNLGDMIFFIAGGAILILAAAALAVWCVARTIRRDSSLLVLLVIIPLVLGVTFSWSAMLEYSGDLLGSYNSLVEAAAR